MSLDPLRASEWVSYIYIHISVPNSMHSFSMSKKFLVSQLHVVRTNVKFVVQSTKQ